MYNNCEAFYDSEEGIGIGPITLKEEIAILKDKQHVLCFTKNRRHSTAGRLQNFSTASNSTDYFTAGDTSIQTKNIDSIGIADSSLEEGNNSIQEAVGNIIKTLDNELTCEIIEIVDDSLVHNVSDEQNQESFEESEIINISSTSSSNEDETLSRQTIPKFKINSPTSNLNLPIALNSQNSRAFSSTSEILSDTQLLQDFSGFHLLSQKDSSAVHSDDESLLLQSTCCEKVLAFADNEKEVAVECDADTESYETARSGQVTPDVPVTGDINTLNGEDHHKEINMIDNSIETENIQAYDDDQFNCTFDRIEYILNSGPSSGTRDFETPKRCEDVRKIPKSAPNTPNYKSSTTSASKGVSPFKVPTKIPRSLRKELLPSTKLRYDDIKSPVAHYIKNSPCAPLIQNQPCGLMTLKQMVAQLNYPASKPKIQWKKITLYKKFYNRGEVEIVQGLNQGKLLKLPANIEAITVDMGVLRRHLGHQGASRLPVPYALSRPDDVDLHSTITSQQIQRADVSLVTEQKVIIN